MDPVFGDISKEQMFFFVDSFGNLDDLQIYFISSIY